MPLSKKNVIIFPGALLEIIKWNSEEIDKMIKVYDYNIARLSAINVAETLKLPSVSLR